MVMVDFIKCVRVCGGGGKITLQQNFSPLAQSCDMNQLIDWLTFFLHSVSSLNSSFVLEVTFITVGDFEIASFSALSSSEYRHWSCSCSFLEEVRRPLRARISSWECFHFCWKVSNFVWSSEFSAVSALHCSLACEWIIVCEIWNEMVKFLQKGHPKPWRILL